MEKQTHVKVSETFTTPTSKTQLNNDSIGYLETYDFSKANMSEESRIACISTVASVCYGNPKAAGSISLYNRLANESAGLPSSSFEFVPVLLKLDSEWLSKKDNEFKTCSSSHYRKLLQLKLRNSFKYGEVITDNDEDAWLLTNLRALMADVGEEASKYLNTEEECKIIAKYHKVFKAKIDIATRTQYIRHRVSWQELSRRYVSGKKSPFEFYTSPRMNIISEHEDDESAIFLALDTFNTICVDRYNQAVAAGVKPEEARRVLPQSMYTTIWSAWQPSQLASFYTLRLDSHAQSEIRELAQAMKDNS